MNKVILNIILFLIPVIGHTCSCIDYTQISVLERINKTDQIFEGIVSNVSNLDEKTVAIEFLIKRKVKGVESLNKVVLKTSSGMCGSQFNQGENWLIFSETNYTGLCSGNFQLFQNSFQEFPISKVSDNYKFYITKLQHFINEISDLKTQREFVEFDQNKNIIAKGVIGSDKLPKEKWFYVDFIIKN